MTVNSLTALASGILNIVVPVAPGRGTLTQLKVDLSVQGQNVVEIDASRIGWVDIFPRVDGAQGTLRDTEVLIVTGLENAHENILDGFLSLMNTRTLINVSFPKMKKIIAVTRGEDAVVWDKLIYTNNTIVAQPAGLSIM